VRGPTQNQESDIWRRVAGIPNFWTTLNPLEPGVVRGIQSLATRYHWHVFFVTQRPDLAGETTQRQTQRWLIQQGFELPMVIVMHGSSGGLADLLQLDVLVDDASRGARYSRGRFGARGAHHAEATLGVTEAGVGDVAAFEPPDGAPIASTGPFCFARPPDGVNSGSRPDGATP